MEEVKIVAVEGREIMDSRGNPTVEAIVTVEVESESKYLTAKASVPSGASTGRFEAVELRDGEQRYLGLGVQKAVKNIREKIAPALIGLNPLNQQKIDNILLELDGTENKDNLGANAVLAVSMAVCRTAAKALGIPLFRYLGGCYTSKMPIPMMNILNGGKHADNTVDFQEFMIMPISADSFKDALRMCSEVYHCLKQQLKRLGFATGVGDEGGFAPNLLNAEECVEQILSAIEMAGYVPGKDFKIALDVAASELYDEKDGNYHFPGETASARMTDCDTPEVIRTAKEMIDYYEILMSRYPIASIEDGLAEEAWDAWKDMTKRLGNSLQLVGDDLFVTNTKRLEAGIKLQAGNAILIKMNQIGTVTETMKTIETAKKSGINVIVSHRSGETEDTFIADLAVAVNAGYIKAGAPCRTERVAKYNRLLRIEETISEDRL